MHLASFLFVTFLLFMPATMTLAREGHVLVKPTHSGQAHAPADANIVNNLEAALEKARQKQLAKIILLPGTHELKQTLVLTRADSGLTIEGRPDVNGQRPIISGAVRVTDWTQADNGWWQAKLPEAVDHENCLVEMYVDGEPVHNARWPNFDPNDPLEGGWAFTCETQPKRKRPHEVYDYQTMREGEIPEFDRHEDVVIHMFPKRDWVSGLYRVTEVDRENRKVFVSVPSTGRERALWPGRRFYYTHDKVLMDQPGEWYYRRDTREIFYIPREGETIENFVAEVPIHRVSVELRGENRGLQPIEDVSIQSVEFRYNTDQMVPRSLFAPLDDAALQIFAGRRVLVEDCRFVYAGGHAIEVADGSNNVKIIGNQIAYPGQGGVMIYGGNSVEDPYANQVSGNDIHNIGNVYKHVAGITVSHAHDNIVNHNRIRRTPRYGINCTGNGFRNVVEYNDLRYTNRETRDTGAIHSHSGSGRHDQHNIYRYNLIRDNFTVMTSSNGKYIRSHLGWGFYFDAYASGNIVHGNIVARSAWGGIMNGAGRNNIYQNNIFIGGSVGQSSFWALNNFVDNITYRRNIIVFPRERSLHEIEEGADLNDPLTVMVDPTYSRAPRLYLANTFSTDGMRELDFNLIDDRGKPELLTQADATPLGTFTQWQEAGMDQNSIIAAAKFIDESADDYRLANDSPAYQLNFQPIPVDRIGLDGYHRSWRGPVEPDPMNNSR